MSNKKIVVRVDSEIQDLVPSFLSNRQRDLGALQEALRESDMDRLRGIGHNLKGVGGGYGFHEITDIGAEIERAAKQGDTSVIDALVKRYSDYLARVEVEYV